MFRYNGFLLRIVHKISQIQSEKNTNFQKGLNGTCKKCQIEIRFTRGKIYEKASGKVKEHSGDFLKLSL